MQIEEMERRIVLMGKLSEYNQKIREDYDKGIAAVLDGTQRVIDFMTKNSPKDETSAVMMFKDFASNVIDPAPLINPIGVEKMIKSLKEPCKPVNPIDEIKIEKDPFDTSVLETVFQKITDLRTMINESDIELNHKYQFEKSIYDIQKYLWDQIKTS